MHWYLKARCSGAPIVVSSGLLSNRQKLTSVKNEMQSKNKKPPTASEKKHIQRVKEMPCIICGASSPSDCHEIKQGQWFTSIPLCRDCHMGSHNGIHGRKAIWNVKRLDELDALALTIEKLITEP